MRSTLRGTLAPLGAALLVAALVAVSGEGALAGTQAKQRVTLQAPLNVTFPGIPQAAPMSSFRVVDPGECGVANYCDTVPLEVVYPDDIPPGDEVRMEVELSWDDTGGSNLDLYLWDNRQIKQQYGRPDPGDANYDPRETDYTLIDSSTINNPETISIPSPDIRDYNLVVHNQDGAAPNYTVKVRLEVDSADEVYEYQEEKKAAAAGSDDSGGSASLDDLESADGAGDASATSAPGSIDPTLDPAFSSADESLLGIEERDIDSELASPALQSSAPLATAKPDPPSGITLVIWLVVLPALMGAGIAYWLRRQRAVFAFPV